MLRLGLDRDDPEARIALLEPARHADESAAGAESQDQPVDPTARLAPHFLGRPFVMRADVVRVDVLSHPEIFAGIPGVHPVGEIPRLVRAAVPGGEHDLGPQRPQDLASLDRHFLSHGDDDRVPLDRAHERKADPGVAARGLQERHARPQISALLRLLDDAQGDPLLDAAHRVEPFHLGVDHHSRIRAHAPEADERRAADGVKDAGTDGRHGASVRRHVTGLKN